MEIGKLHFLPLIPLCRWKTFYEPVSCVTFRIPVPFFVEEVCTLYFLFFLWVGILANSFSRWCGVVFHKRRIKPAAGVLFCIHKRLAKMRCVHTSIYFFFFFVSFFLFNLFPRESEGLRTKPTNYNQSEQNFATFPIIFMYFFFFSVHNFDRCHYL